MEVHNNSMLRRAAPSRTVRLFVNAEMDGWIRVSGGWVVDGGVVEQIHDTGYSCMEETEWQSRGRPTKGRYFIIKMSFVLCRVEKIPGQSNATRMANGKRI